MKKYEKNLKSLIALTNGGRNPVHQNNTSLTSDELRFLSAKGLLKLTSVGKDQFLIVLTSAGLTYFSEKSEAREDFLKNHFASFLTGFASGILFTLVSSWLIKLVL